MAYQVLRCPYCGAGEIQNNGEKYHCPYCNCDFTDDSADRAYKKIYAGLDSQMRGVVDDAMFRKHEEDYYNLRSLLWEKVHANYIDSEAIVSVCRDIKKLAPQDFLACFFEVANAGTPDEVEQFLNKISPQENELFMDLVLDFMLKSLTSKYIMPTAYLIERAYKNSDLKKYEEYTTRLEQEAVKVEAGVYSTLAPRDVFIAYSSRDIDKVIELMNLLESNGLSCFVAMRNLQHGRDAVANYSAALRAAIDNSKYLVFVSSKHSRSFSCDALTEELKYIREKELSDAPAAYKRDYAKLPYQYKKLRVEYRLDNTASPTDRFVGEFFAGLDYCETPEKVLARLTDYELVGMDAEPLVEDIEFGMEIAPAIPKEETVKTFQKRVEERETTAQKAATQPVPAPSKPTVDTKNFKSPKTEKGSWTFFLFFVLAIALGAVEMSYVTKNMGGWGIFFLGILTPFAVMLIPILGYRKPLTRYKREERKVITDNACGFTLFAFIVAAIVDCFFIHSTRSIILKILISIGINIIPYIIVIGIIASMDHD